jgi:riboflavin kinase/FMN adenylyltransferase
VTELGLFVPPPEGTAVTIGAFDGVHRGHRSLIAQVRSLAAERRLASVVLTFDRHPATVVRPASAPLVLTDLDQKLELLESTGVDHVVVLPFDRPRSLEEAEDFVAEVLVGALGARVVVVGEDFHFGRGRRGTVALLRAMGDRLGFEVARVEFAREPGLDGPVSSTAVRALLAGGQVELAADLLGRPHEVRGVVGRGDGRGHDLGFPTANVTVPDGVQLPAPGIYAGWFVRAGGPASPGDGPLAAAISLGVRPTFHDDGASPTVLEAYLLDFEGDLYGEAVRVRFVSRLRDERRFPSVGELVEQMARDVQATRQALGAPR